MIFTFNKETKELKTYTETTLKKQNILEKDLEHWVESLPDILGEELLIITTEYDKFDKTNERFDILAVDKDGTLVVIELKRDDSGKYADLQAIKYAAYCSNLTLDDVIKMYLEYQREKGIELTEQQAQEQIEEFIDNDDFEQFSDRPRIILVSKEYKPEVTASVLWLRKFGIDITCVKLTPYEMDKDTIVFESTILIPLPEAKDFIIQTEKKEQAESTSTLTQEKYNEFYNELIDRLKAILPRNYAKPMSKNYYQIPTGKTKTHFEWAFHGRPRSSFAVELHFESGDRQFNLKLIEKLEKFVPKLEEATGEKVIVQKEWGKNWARMYIEKNEGRMTEELKEWAVGNMKKFIEILQPELEKFYN
jgi:hypothetical protein